MRSSGRASRLYKVSRAHNELIRSGDYFKGRLLDTDWVVALGSGEYMVVHVSGYRVVGIPEYRFAAKPMGQPVRWQITDREVALLRAGEIIEAPMDLDGIGIEMMRVSPRVARNTTPISVGE